MKIVTFTDEAVARLEAWKLTPDESLSDVILRKVEAPPAPAVDAPTHLFGSLAAVMHFGPGWENPLPSEDWEALRDETDHDGSHGHPRA